MADKRYSIDEYAEALQATGGLVALTARRMGISYQAVAQRVQDSPRLQAIVKSAREELADTAEAALKRAVINGEAWAVIKALNLRKQFYSERTEHTGPEGGPVIIKVEYADDDSTD